MSELQRLLNGLALGPADALVHRSGFRTFTYSGLRLLEFCQKMGGVFSSCGLKKGDRVLIWGHNSAEYIIALFGCLLHGIVAVPIDVRHPLETVHRIARHSGARLVICPAEYHSLNLKRINLDDLTFIADEHRAVKPVKVGDAQLGEIVYTSGTTDVPKGVMLSHGNLSANFHQVSSLDIFARSRILNVLPLSHMFGQMGVIYCLLGGHSLVLADSIKPSSLSAALSEHHITHLPSVPRLLDGLARKLPWPQRLSARLFFGRSFRQFIVGGAALDTKTEQFFSGLGYTPYVGYGLTETSPVLTCNGPGRYKLQTAGKALDHTDIRLADDGEILARGPQIFSGYYKNIAKTREVLTSGWFSTGDLGSIDEEGYVKILGRKKDVIVTSGGVNVYPEDIERALNRIRGVKDSCVLGFGKGEDTIHAVLLLEASAQPRAQSIIDEANTHLDDTSRITAFTIWNEADFPRTPTHKVRKFVVKERIENGLMVSSATQEADRVTIAISKFSKKSITDSTSLGSLGLSSIDRIELVSDLEQTFGIDLDEDKFTPKLTVSGVRELITHPPSTTGPALWPLSWWARTLRFISRPVLYTLLVRPFVQAQIVGREYLYELTEPCILVVNHESHFDGPTIFWTLPHSLSHRLAPATWKEYFSSSSLIKKTVLRIIEILAKLTHNIFLLPQESSALQGLRHAGWLLDHGWNILFFPEGSRSTTGKLRGIHSGIGLLAKHTRAPIVPIKLDGLFEVLPAGKFWPKRGNVTVTIGEPIRFSTESPVEIVNNIETVLKKM